jgi:hypothetical protein
MMRTTLNIPDDVFEVIRSLADARKLSLGDAAAELIRKGLEPDARIRNTPGIFPAFSIPPGAAPITLEQTLAAEDEL